MQYNRPPDRRPMSEGNKLIIFILVLVIFGAGAVSIFLNRRGSGGLSGADTTAEPAQQSSLPSVDEALGHATQAPSTTPAVSITPEPSAEPTETPVPNFYMTPAPTEVPTLKLNSSGDEVKKMQGRLIELGYLRQGADDGQFGKGTQNAVKAFQATNGLNADGAAGAKTLTLLYSDDAKAKEK